MEFEKHTLTFLDGYSFEAELNGNCYFPVDIDVNSLLQAFGKR